MINVEYKLLKVCDFKFGGIQKLIDQEFFLRNKVL